MRRMRRKSNDAAFTEKARHDCAGGEHTGAGRGCKGRPQCGTVHEKTERRNKNRQHANSQQRDDRVKECTRHGIMGAFCGWGVWWRGQNRGWTGDRRAIMLQKNFMSHFQKLETFDAVKMKPFNSCVKKKLIYSSISSFPLNFIFIFPESGLF